jgi:hypothetical protein
VTGFDGPAYGSPLNPEPLDWWGGSLLRDPPAAFRRSRGVDFGDLIERASAEARAWHDDPRLRRQRELSRAAGGGGRSYVTHRNPHPSAGRQWVDPRVRALDGLEFGVTRAEQPDLFAGAGDYPGLDHEYDPYCEGCVRLAAGDW